MGIPGFFGFIRKYNNPNNPNSLIKNKIYHNSSNHNNNHNQEKPIKQHFFLDFNGAIYTVNHKYKPKTEESLAAHTINYLEKEISETKLIEVRQGLSKLVENQAEKMMFARATPEFLFKILASPYAPEIKSRPSRILYFIISFIISFVTAFFYFLAIHFLNRNQDK